MDWSMKRNLRNNGSVLLMTVFVVALLSVLIMGMLQMNTEEIQLMQNQIYAAQALAIAEAGLNDVFAKIRDNKNWAEDSYQDSFEGGSYIVSVTGTLPNRTVVSRGTSSKGFVAQVEADITVGSAHPYVIRIDSLRINE
jgi:Tfp pilus assembly protein PilX